MLFSLLFALTCLSLTTQNYLLSVVQIIDDDKGVHLIAAVNLSESIPECSLLGLEICRELSAKQVGCAIGMASGSTFCGVIGSSDIACRWDIAGPTPVRAARLMQYALLSHTPLIAIDQSVYNDPMSFTRMKLFDPFVTIKGAAEPIPVYTLSESESSAAFRVLETVHGTRIGSSILISVFVS
jgi:class 3 adenylate cyclase